VVIPPAELDEFLMQNTERKTYCGERVVRMIDNVLGRANQLL
jgi:hypothetical protein